MLTVQCRKCSHILYQSDSILKTPSEVITNHGGRCPQCGRSLELESRRITVGAEGF